MIMSDHTTNSCAGYRLFAIMGLAVALTVGCGYPNAEPANQELTVSLRTALSARNEEWLTANESIIDKRHADKQMGDAIHAVFRAIIAQARSGDWAGAERETLQFQRAQRPTAEQVTQVTKRLVN